MTQTKKKERKVVIHIENEELKRIVDNELGGVTIEMIVKHSNIKVDARTGEDEQVKIYRFGS